MSGIRSKLSVHWLSTLGASFATMLAAACLLSVQLDTLLNSRAVQASDRTAWNLARSLSSPMLQAVAALSNDLHGTLGILLLTAAGAWGWRRYGHPDACIRLLVAVPLGMLLNVAVKAAVHRARPAWSIVDLPLSFSFPSGHVAEATVFYGSLAIEIATHEGRRFQKGFYLAGAAVMIAIVASSRIIVGVHFLSDCIGAIFEGVLWLAACFSRSPLTSSPDNAGDR